MEVFTTQRKFTFIETKLMYKVKTYKNCEIDVLVIFHISSSSEEKVYLTDFKLVCVLKL